MVAYVAEHRGKTVRLYAILLYLFVIAASSEFEVV